MNKPLFIAAAILLAGSMPAAEPQTIRFDFASQPEMSEASRPGGR